MSLGALALSLVLLLANGFFVAIEFGLMTARRSRLEALADRGNSSAAIALAQSHEISLQLAGAQLGVTMASLGLGAVAEPAIGHLIGSGLEAVGVPEGAVGTIEFVAALTIVVFLHMVIGEMVPKNLALAGPERTMTVLAWPNRLYVALFRPVIRFLNGLADQGARLFGVRAASEAEPAHTPEDIAAMVASSREEGLIEEFEHELLVGALDLEQREVVEVMVPSGDVAWASTEASVAELEQAIVDSGHSRLPVVGPEPGASPGFLHAKDLLDVDLADRDRPWPSDRLHPMLVVPADQHLGDVLRRMQAQRKHLAVIVDASGQRLGIASLEDVLEELVGDIRDESDPAEDEGGT
jgi:magnesium and cobalt exporter, CNNM family